MNTLISALFARKTVAPAARSDVWAWRPDLWTAAAAEPAQVSPPTRSRLGGDVTLFHDCPLAEITLRQIATRTQPPFALSLEVFRFDGAFLSLVVDLPDAALAGLNRHAILTCDLAIEAEKPVEIFARLNLRHGANTEQVLREVPKGQAAATVAFDLAYAGLGESAVEQAWIDLIFENPRMNRIVLHDMALSRRLRAQI